MTVAMLFYDGRKAAEQNQFGCPIAHGELFSEMDTNHSDDRDERTVYVRNLHENVTKELLEELFMQMGSLVSVLIRDCKGPSQAANDQRETSGVERKRFAFVEFQDVESVLFAVEMLDDVALFGQRIVVAPRDRTQQAEKYRQQRDRFLLTRVRQDQRQQKPSFNSSKSRHGSGALPFVDGTAALASALLHHVGNAIGGRGPQRLTLAAFDQFTQPPPPPQLCGAVQQPRHSVSGQQPHSSSSTRCLLAGGDRGDDYRDAGTDSSSWRNYSQQRHSEGGSWRSAPYSNGSSRHQAGGGQQRTRSNHSTHNNSKTYFRR